MDTSRDISALERTFPRREHVAGFSRDFLRNNDLINKGDRSQEREQDSQPSTFAQERRDWSADKDRITIKDKMDSGDEFVASDAGTGDGEGASELVGDESVGIDPEEMEGGGEEILGRDGRLSDFAADLIALADDPSPGDTSAGEEAGVDLGPVFAAGTGRGAVDLGGASVFADAEDEGFVEHAALVEVFYECGEGMVEDGEQVVFESRIVIVVGVPAGGEMSVGVPENGDETPAGFEHTSGRKKGLAEERHTVAFAKGDRFSLDIDGLGHFSGGEKRPGEVLKAIERVDSRMSCKGELSDVELFLKGSTKSEALGGDAFERASWSGNFKAVFGTDSCKGVEEVTALFAERLGNFSSTARGEVGPDGIELAAEESAVGTAEGSELAFGIHDVGHRDVAGDVFGSKVGALLIEVVDDRADAGPELAIIGVGFNDGLGGDPGHRIGHMMKREIVRE